MVLLLLLLTAKGHLEIIDTEYSVRTAISILEEQTLQIELVDSNVLGIMPNIEGSSKIYSQYGLGLVVIFLPVVMLAKIVSLIVGIDQRIIIDFLISFYNIPFALISLYFFRLILFRCGINYSVANLMMFVLFCGTAFWKYSVTDFSEITQLAFILGGISSTLSPAKNKWRMVSLWLALLIMMKLVYIIFIPIFLIYAVSVEIYKFKLKNIHQILFDFCLFLIPTAIIIASANFIRYGHVFETGYGSQASSFSLSYFLRDWFEYLASSQRGIFPFNPILLLALPGWFFLPKQNRMFFALIAAIIISWYVLMCFWKSLQGGYCWGNRLLVPILPLILIPLAFIPLRNLIIQTLFWPLLFLSVGIQVTAVCTKTHEISLLRSEIHSQTGLATSPQLISTVRLFFHKIENDSTKIPASSLGIKSNKSFDFSDFESFYGLNLWPVHSLKFLGMQKKCYLMSWTLLSLIVAMLIYIGYRFGFLHIKNHSY